MVIIGAFVDSFGSGSWTCVNSSVIATCSACWIISHDLI